MEGVGGEKCESNSLDAIRVTVTLLGTAAGPRYNIHGREVHQILLWGMTCFLL